MKGRFHEHAVCADAVAPEINNGIVRAVDVLSNLIGRP
jgi:hypothetical protein